MKIFFLLVIGIILTLACARVRVEAPKEPIKVDISMRLDIYQHVVKDIDKIESIVSGSQEKTKPKDDKQSLLGYFIGSVYAQGELNPEIEQAALRRKDRYSELTSWEGKGVIGENRSGLLEIRNPQQSNPSLDNLVKAENSDRMIIYKSVAKKNNVTVEEIQKIYAERLQKSAPSGTPIEVFNSKTAAYEWKIK